VINPFKETQYNPSENAIIGNCALYGATGGTLYVHGLAGDRFAVRNSGAVAVVEGTGMHPCEYMTNGTVVILGTVSSNVGAGMTGGTLYLRRDQLHQINEEYVTPLELDKVSSKKLKKLITDYFAKTNSGAAKMYLDNWAEQKKQLVRLKPNGVIANAKAAAEDESEKRVSLKKAKQ